MVVRVLEKCSGNHGSFERRCSSGVEEGRNILRRQWKMVRKGCKVEEKHCEQLWRFEDRPWVLAQDCISIKY